MGWRTREHPQRRHSRHPSPRQNPDPRCANLDAPALLQAAGWGGEGATTHPRVACAMTKARCCCAAGGWLAVLGSSTATPGCRGKRAIGWQAGGLDRRHRDARADDSTRRRCVRAWRCTAATCTWARCQVQAALPHAASCAPAPPCHHRVAVQPTPRAQLAPLLQEPTLAAGSSCHAGGAGRQGQALPTRPSAPLHNSCPPSPTPPWRVPCPPGACEHGRIAGCLWGAPWLLTAWARSVHALGWWRCHARRSSTPLLLSGRAAFPALPPLLLLLRGPGTRGGSNSTGSASSSSPPAPSPSAAAAAASSSACMRSAAAARSLG